MNGWDLLHFHPIPPAWLLPTRTKLQAPHRTEPNRPRLRADRASRGARWPWRTDGGRGRKAVVRTAPPFVPPKHRKAEQEDAKAQPGSEDHIPHKNPSKDLPTQLQAVKYAELETFRTSLRPETFPLKLSPRPRDFFPVQPNSMPCRYLDASGDPNTPARACLLPLAFCSAEASRQVHGEFRLRRDDRAPAQRAWTYPPDRPSGSIPCVVLGLLFSSVALSMSSATELRAEGTSGDGDEKELGELRNACVLSSEVSTWNNNVVSINDLNGSV